MIIEGAASGSLKIKVLPTQTLVYLNNALVSTIAGSHPISSLTWYAVASGKLAPTGWHVATISDWTALDNYLIANGYNFDGSLSGNKVAKALSAAIGWNSSTVQGAPGNDQTLNNRSGFTALAAGFRFHDHDSSWLHKKRRLHRFKTVFAHYAPHASVISLLLKMRDRFL